MIGRGRAQNGAQFRPVDTPRPPAVDALDGRSPGSRVVGLVPPSHLMCSLKIQDTCDSGILEPDLAAYSCGGSQGIIDFQLKAGSPCSLLPPSAANERTSGTIKQGA